MSNKVAVIYKYRANINDDNYTLGRLVRYIKGDVISIDELRETEEMISRYSGVYGYPLIINVFPVC